MNDNMNNAPSWSALVDRPMAFLKRRLGMVTPASSTGMGATADGDRTSFRVWAPNADSVFVAGAFNNWSTWRTPLVAEGDGCWSVTVRAAKPGDEFKYVIRRNGESLIRTDPYARHVTRPYQNSVIVTPEETAPSQDGFAMAPLNELVLYELHVGTFFAQERRDGRGSAGDFASVVRKLPYLRALGINAIELMPVKEFAGDYSWGYNPGHPFAVSNAYGGREALRALIRAAHQQGIAVIIDVVYNHFGPQDLALWQYDGWHENGHGGIYFYNDWRAETPWAHTRPDYGRQEVRRYLAENARMWLEELGADGLRWDATSYIRSASGFDGDESQHLPDGFSLMCSINDEIHTLAPGRISIAEDMQKNPALSRATEHGGAGFDAQWDADFVHTVRQAVIGAQDEDRSMAALGNVLAARFNDTAFDRVIFTESHDEVANGKARVPEEISPGDAASYYAKKRSTLGAVVVFTAPGIPMIFQGQEFLEDRWFDDHVPLDWRKAQTHSGIVHLYCDLIRLRRNYDKFSAGLAGPHIHVFLANDEHKVLAFHRWEMGGPGDDVVIVANFANRMHKAYTVGFPREGVWRVRFNSDRRIYASSFGDHRCPDIVAARSSGEGSVMPYWGNITLAPYTALIFSQD